MRGGGAEMARKFLKGCAKHMWPIVHVQKQITRNFYYMLRKIKCRYDMSRVMAMILISWLICTPHVQSTSAYTMHCMTDKRNCIIIIINYTKN